MCLTMINVRVLHSSQENPFEFIVASLCPGILGHELIKAGLILALFGGTRQRDDSADKAVQVRENRLCRDLDDVENRLKILD